MAYATVTQLKAHLSIAETDTDHDGYLAEALNRATEYIDLYTGQTFSSSATTHTDEEHYRKGRIIWLNHPGVTAISSVKVRDIRSDALTTLDSTTYEWMTNGRLELPSPYTFVYVTYTVAASLPLAIEQAAISLAANAFRSTGERGAVREERVGDLAIKYADVATSADPLTLSMLDAYRLRHI